jgi:hypothetical protein
MMSDRANAWISGQTAYVFAGSVASGGPQFFGVDLATGAVSHMGQMVPYIGETEFWYWTPDGWVMIGVGSHLHRVNPFTGDDEIVLDISATHPGHTLDQWHSSDNGTTHSATVKDPSYQKVGTVTMHNGKQDYWPKVGVLDESQVRRDGRGVCIKENGDDNRYIDLDTRETTWLRDHQRAIGHSDCGPDYVVGEADKPDPGGCVIWYFDRLNSGPTFLFPTLNLGYVSTRGGRCLHSGDTHLSLIDLQTGAATPILEHGAHAGNDYDLRVKANLDPSGRIATYMLRGSVYLVGVA